MPCEAACHETEVCDEDPGFGAFDGFLDVVCEPAAPAKPGDGAVEV